MTVRSLHVYPVKGARGIALEHAEVLASGIRHDRRFMLVAGDGAFITQRTHARLALVETAIEGDTLTLRAADAALELPLVPPGTPRRVRVWKDDVDALDLGEAPARFFGAFLGLECSLVYLPLDAIRAVEPAYARPGDRVGFADAYPVLVASLASLADLNDRLTASGAPAVPMDRFRPNVVIDGDAPFVEEERASIDIGALHLRTPKRCSRCKVVTIDQATATAGREPLRMLASYRTQANNVYFAMNAIPDIAPDASVTIRVGDPVR